MASFLSLSYSSAPILLHPCASTPFKLFSKLHNVNPSIANGLGSNLVSVGLSYKSPSSDKKVSRIKAKLTSGGRDLGSYPNNSDAVKNGDLVDNDNFDLDTPKQGFASIPEAIEDIRNGKMVIVVDDAEKENGGDFIMAAELVTPEAMAFIVKHGTGIVCVSMKEEDLERLELPLMAHGRDNNEKLHKTFTVSVDGKHGTTTGVSARDRATTILALVSKDSKPSDFNRPGHVFPLKYREHGVLNRVGHAEASVDLVVLAGLNSTAVLSEIVDEDGSLARLPKLLQFAEHENLKLISIHDLIRYRKNKDKLVEHASAALIPTTWGLFTANCYKSIVDGMEHIAMVKGDIGDGEDVLVRIHSECFTGDIFGSFRCDCGNQLALAMRQIEAVGRGVLVYLRGQEGRGIGLGNKLRAYKLQDDGKDTVEANQELGLPIDSRDYGVGAQILRDLGVRSMKLMTNNPTKCEALKGYGLKISGRIPTLTLIRKENRRYLETKRVKMGHIYGSEFNSELSDSNTGNGEANAIDGSNSATGL